MVGKDALISQLETEYCPPLDSATFLAILSDFDIRNAEQLQNARNTLDMVADSVDAEEATGFDPSGSSGQDISHNEVAESGSGYSQQGWSSYTDDTSLSQGMSAHDLEGLNFPEARTDIGETEAKDDSFIESYNTQLDSLDEPSKEAILIETFPGLKPFDIKWTLNKCKGDAGQAIEELLNQVFLQSSGHRFRGIEAFSEREGHARPRKGKAKKNRIVPTESPNSSNGQTVTESKWDVARRNVEFISSKTGMPMQQVSGIYHENSSSVPATIVAIVDSQPSHTFDTLDPEIAANTQELIREFPSIKSAHLQALALLTYPFTAHAHELAKALSTRKKPTSITPNIQIEFRLPPPDLSGGAAAPSKPKSHNAVYTAGTGPSFMSATATGNSQNGASSNYLTLRNEAFTRASAAYKRSKSNHLMGGVAAYYSSLGHDYDARTKSALAAEADALVASQSTPTSLDLHGVNVKEALRIASENVTAWWAIQGGREVHTGFRIITGKGTHSEGGKGRLGPAVEKMLINEGWKVEVGNGFLVVTGVVGRR